MFRVGQKVVCIADPRPEAAANFPGQVINWTKRGNIYTVRTITPLRYWTMIRLAEVDNSHLDWHGGEPGFEDIHFRPIVDKKTDISIFTSMLKPSKVNA